MRLYLHENILKVCAPGKPYRSMLSTSSSIVRGSKPLRARCITYFNKNSSTRRARNTASVYVAHRRMGSPSQEQMVVNHAR